ncbi:MAG TPA: hypothetical protein VGJ85_07920 [Candidatus Nanopelagicaceae bacterium]|jgi:hypothetical protein
MSQNLSKGATPIWKNLRLLYLFAGTMLVVTVSNVMRTSWAGDDWPNSQTPYWVKWRYGSLTPSHIWYEAQYWNNQWMQGQGRFYVVQWIESRFVFSYFRSLWQYKLVETGALLLAGLLFAYLLYKVSRSHSLTLLTLVFLSITIQFRRDFDPHIAFVFMVPSLLIKVFLAAILAHRAARAKTQMRGIWISILAGIIFFIGMSTYEYAFLLFPIILIAFLAGILQNHESRPVETETGSYKKYLTKELWIFLPIAISWVGYGLFVFGYLRAKAQAISGAYVLGTSLKSIPTFLSQLVPPWPLTVFHFSDIGKFSLNRGTELFGIGFALLGAYLLYGLLAHTFGTGGEPYFHATKAAKLYYWAIVLIGIDLLCSPAFMLSIQKDWWNRAGITHSYLGILVQEFGSALFLALLVTFFIGRNIKVAVAQPKKGKGGRK